MKKITKMTDSDIGQQNLGVCNFKFARLALKSININKCMAKNKLKVVVKLT